MPPEITLIDLFLPIFIGMGPVKVLLVYMALTKNASTALHRKVAIRTISTEKKEEAGPVSEEVLMSMAIYPLAIPLLLNPVGIVTLSLFSAEAQGLLQLGVLVILVLVVAAIDLGVFLISHRLDKYLTHERILVLEKLMGGYFWLH
jgi:small neutral amino acid transporter SnatA (MarC family)